MNYAITKQTVTVVHDGKSYTVPDTSPNFRLLRAALLAEDFVLALSFLDVKRSIENWASSDGAFKVKDNNITFKGEVVHDVIAAKIIEMLKDGENATPLLKFYEKLSKNPSHRSVTQLWKFLEHCNIPLTPDGCFLAYKGVTTEYLDCHSRTVDNHVGCKPEMDRNKISDDPNEACHVGLHVGALEYAKSFGPQVVICKVDPENVVCIPYDASHMKMRVCKYEVVGDFAAPLTASVNRDFEPQHPGDDEFDDGQDEDYENDDCCDCPACTGCDWDDDVDEDNDYSYQDMNLDDLRKYAVHEVGLTGVYRMTKSELLNEVKTELGHE